MRRLRISAHAYLQMKLGWPNYIGLRTGFNQHDRISVLAFAALAFALYYFARKPMAK